LEKALKVNKKDGRIYFYIGAAYERMVTKGDVQPGTEEKRLAIENLRKAIELSPESPEAYNYLGYIFAEEEMNMDEAVQLIKKALELDPENPAYIDSLGWVYYKKGMVEEAVEELKKAASLEKEDPTIRDHLGDAYYKKGLFDKARIQWEKSLELNPDRKDIRQKIKKVKNQKTKVLN